jgi:hypothetical protein
MIHTYPNTSLQDLICDVMTAVLQVRESIDQDAPENAIDVVTNAKVRSSYWHHTIQYTLIPQSAQHHFFITSSSSSPSAASSSSSSSSSLFLDNDHRGSG